MDEKKFNKIFKKLNEEEQDLIYLYIGLSSSVKENNSLVDNIKFRQILNNLSKKEQDFIYCLIGKAFVGYWF